MKKNNEYDQIVNSAKESWILDRCDDQKIISQYNQTDEVPEWEDPAVEELDLDEPLYADQYEKYRDREYYYSVLHDPAENWILADPKIRKIAEECGFEVYEYPY